MLKGNCPNCNQLMQWDQPKSISEAWQVYVLQCPDVKCGVRVAVQNDAIVPVVKAEKAPAEVMYVVYYVGTDGVHRVCNEGLKMSYERAKSNIEAGNKMYDYNTYYMKPVLDGLA